MPANARDGRGAGFVELLGFRGFCSVAGAHTRRGFFLFLAGGSEPLVVLVDAAGRVDQLLRSGKERVTRRADLNVDLRQGRTGRKGAAAVANDFGRGVPLGMNLVFHSSNILAPVARLGRGAVKQ